MKMFDLIEISRFAKNAYKIAGKLYDGNDYFYHINMVDEILLKYDKIFYNHDDFLVTRAAIFCHDLIEDAGINYAEIMKIANKDVADITLAVTDVHAENRLMRHLLTMHKTVSDHRAIILKMCDILANASYSKSIMSGMYKKYKAEYNYRKPIFTTALKWYKPHLNQFILNDFWDELDEVHGFIN
jgi:(p)ppGpp synthase/HD superfamily hydrolase